MNKEELKKKIREIVRNHQDGAVFKELEEGCVNKLTVLFTEIEEKTKKELNSKLQESNEKITGETSDGYHTFNELYEFRKLYNAGFFNLLPKECGVHKSKKHSDGEDCFGGGWFIVTAYLNGKQISNHYELKDWDLFNCEEREKADVWDGHTPQDVTVRLKEYLQYNKLNGGNRG